MVSGPRAAPSPGHLWLTTAGENDRLRCFSAFDFSSVIATKLGRGIDYLQCS